MSSNDSVDAKLRRPARPSFSESSEEWCSAHEDAQDLVVAECTHAQRRDDGAVDAAGKTNDSAARPNMLKTCWRSVWTIRSTSAAGSSVNTLSPNSRAVGMCAARVMTALSACKTRPACRSARPHSRPREVGGEVGLDDEHRYACLRRGSRPGLRVSNPSRAIAALHLGCSETV